MDETLPAINFPVTFAYVIRRIATSSAHREILLHSTDYAVARCLSVCPAVCPLHSGILLKRLNIGPIIKVISSSGSQTILDFPYQTGWQYSDGDPPPPKNGGAECKGV